MKERAAAERSSVLGGLRAQLYLRLFTATLFAVIFVARAAGADEGKSRSCDGPEKCCPAELVDEIPPRRKSVEVGVVLEGLHEVNEKNSTWTGDF